MSVRASGDQNSGLLPSRRPRTFGNRGRAKRIGECQTTLKSIDDYTSQYTIIDNAIVYVTTFVKGLVPAAAATKRSRTRG